MSKLNELRSKGTIIKLSNELELNITPMTLGEEADVTSYKDGEMIKAVSFLVKNAMKRAIPDATDDEIESVNKLDLQLITKTVLEVNGLTETKNTEAKKNSNEN